MLTSRGMQGWPNSFEEFRSWIKNEKRASSAIYSVLSEICGNTAEKKPRKGLKPAPLWKIRWWQHNCEELSVKSGLAHEIWLRKEVLLLNPLLAVCPPERLVLMPRSLQELRSQEITSQVTSISEFKLAAEKFPGFRIVHFHVSPLYLNKKMLKKQVVALWQTFRREAPLPPVTSRTQRCPFRPLEPKWTYHKPQGRRTQHFSNEKYHATWG